MVVGLGVRQGIGKAGILAASALFTPADVELWADPYVEGEDRRPTELDFPGFRLRWGSIFGTGLELSGPSTRARGTCPRFTPIRAAARPPSRA